MSFGGGGGGGSSGSVSNEAYFSAWHESILGDPCSSGGTGIISNAVIILNEYWAANPYSFSSAQSVTTLEAKLTTATNAIYALVGALDPVTDWQSYIAYVTIGMTDQGLISTSALTAAEAAYNAVLDAEYVNVTLPRFQRGMQDANAVMSSAFVVGEALLEAEVLRKKANYSAELRLQNFKQKIDATMSGVDSMVKLASIERDVMLRAASLYIEGNRITYVASKEETDRNVELDAAAAKWDMEALPYAGNLLAASHGGVSNTNTSRPSAAQSVLGGAMSGASLGSSVSPGWGTLIGAIGGAAFGIGQQIAG